MDSRLGPALILGSALLLGSACKKSEDPAPEAPAPKPAAPTEPAPSYTLSFLEAASPSGCTWTRHESTGTRKPLATVDAVCERLKLAWGPRGRQGLMVDRGNGELPPRAWQVDFESGQASRLLLPETGHTDTLGFDEEGHVVALVSQLDDLPRKMDSGREYLLHEGKRYLVPDADGTPGLAHAYRHEAGQWKHLETVVSLYEIDGAAGTNALATSSRLTSSTFMRDPDRLVESELVEGSEDAARLDAVVKDRGHTTYGMWIAMETHQGPLYAWEAASELPTLMLPLRWEANDKLVEPELLALAPTSTVELRMRGHLLLVSAEQAARVYDAKTKKRLAALEGVHGARFWPRQRTVTAAVPASAVTVP
ncbi:hypothetical protein [Comamonas sp. JC664]|uniref:hypothetical protein n=1 Tax=Comamonas sp. JC664 TaxID=2801917 RepID=UPI00174C6558|nr:hypothetical protein [Comamonas sp. JC664]MBL0698679.1 hypothetical protein [Comamonas sp. JC664]GHG78479.1 hypothetical protein GCM10012319_29050 [Comamonas sp. KCTC 72670]